MTEKWIVDDAGTLINMSTRKHYDYMEEVVDVLNKLSEENGKLKQAYQTLKHRHSLLHDEYLETECAMNILKKDVISLEKENAQLRDKLFEYDSIAEKICEWDFDEIVKVINAQQETEKENEQLKQTIKTIKKLCNQNRIPSLLTTYIPVNCEKKKGCLDNHMINAGNMGRSNIANEILQLIDGDKDD